MAAMEYCYYALRSVPDFSLNKYASLSETGPSGVIAQHRAFWRQLNQWGVLFHGSIHFFYQYDPGRQPGERMILSLRFDAPDREAKNSIRQIMSSSILAPYYDELLCSEISCLNGHLYAWQVNLLKKERFVVSSSHEQEKYYIVSKWKMNPEARLYSMLRIMAASDSHCVYHAALFPVDYGAKAEESLKFILPHLRERNSFKVKTAPGAISGGGRDEDAKKALEFYEDLMDGITVSPHFLMNVQVLAETEGTAKQILDAAVCEALQEGNHTLYGERFGQGIEDAAAAGFCCWSDPGAPEHLMYLPHLMTLEEAVPFVMLPVLYPGEFIEMPKETVPAKKEGMLIGHDTQRHEICYPWNRLAQHAFLAGMPGSGKTNTMMYFMAQMHREGIPVLVLEPAKREYRVLAADPAMRDISLFSPGANSMFPLHINPFEFPKGMKLADHINRLLDVFNGTFQLDPPMPMLLTEGIQNCYEKLLWLPGMVNRGELEYPTMSMLYTEIETLLDKYQYAEEVRSNLQSILQVRIGSLLAREMGDIFDVKGSTFAPEEWLEKSAVIELASMGSGPANFMTLMLMTLIREVLDVRIYDAEKFGGRPRHAIYLEEAHNLIANTGIQQAGVTDPKISATAFITKMLAEVRALGECMVIADQLPTAMAPEVVKNTSLKIALRLTAQDERALLGAAMSADEVQSEQMATFSQGQCLVSYEGLLRPFEMQIPGYKEDGFADDAYMLKCVLCSELYHENMLQSARIMEIKFREKQERLLSENRKLYDRIECVRKKWKDNADIVYMENEGEEGYIASDEMQKWLTEKRKLQNTYGNLMKGWCRLSLDITLYVGVTYLRRQRLADWEADFSEEEKRRATAAHNKWLDLMTKLYSDIKTARAGFKNTAEKLAMKPLDELEEQFIRQQEIIKRGWVI